MEVAILEYTEDSGWSGPFPEWDSPKTLIVAFGAAEFGSGQGPLDELLAAYRFSHLLGCSTAGEINGDRVSDRSIVVAVCRFRDVHLRSARARCMATADSFAAGRSVGETLREPDLRAVFVLSDGLRVNGSELTRGLSAGVGDGVVVTGGLAGDGDRFESTWVIGEDGASQGEVAAVGLYGERLEVAHGCQGGWSQFGPERLVTASDGNVLHSLDGRSALSLYREYLGELADGLPATGLLFPLALRRDAEDGATVVRTILSIDEDAGSLTFAGDIPEGSYAQLMRANIDRLVEGAERAAEEAMLGGDHGPALAIGVSCVGRRLVLGERIEEEVEAVRLGLAGDAAQIGFYSYGEISPLVSGRCDLHNQTMTLTTLRERAA